MMKQAITFFSILFMNIALTAQIIVIDAGHGYLADCSNGDGRTKTEINTSHEVSVRLRNLIQNNYCGWTVYLTRPNNSCNSWVSVTQRGVMANNWNANLFLSIHCNAASFTAYGTETFWCDLATTSNAGDKDYATRIQNAMVSRGHWPNRRVVEDNSYLGYHLGVLKNLGRRGCLSEIGFVTSTDSVKLLSSAWRDSFALAYFEGLRTQLGKSCIGVLCDKAPTVGCGQSYNGTSSTALSTVSTYGCNTWLETAPERVHKVVLNSSGAVTASIENFTGDLDVYILSSKNPANCVGSVYSNGAFYNNAPAGTYYVVVDAPQLNGSAYKLTVNCTKTPDFGSSKLTATKVTGYTRRYSVVNDVNNYGGATGGSIEMGYFLSTDQTYSSNDIFLTTHLITSAVSSAQKTTVTKTIDIPSNVALGNYYILSYADVPGYYFPSIVESNESNNVRAVAVSITSSPARMDDESRGQSQDELAAFAVEDATKVYPNPVSNELFIEINEQYTNSDAYIYNLEGQQVLAQKNIPNFYTFDMSSLASGVYVVHLKNDVFSQYHKVIKN